MRASRVSPPTFSARMIRLPVPGPLLDRHGLARDHRLVDRARPFEPDPIHRDLLSRAHAQAIADMHLCQRDILLRSSVIEPPRRLRGEAEQRLQRAARLAAGAELEHLAEEHQRGDHAGGLEVDRDLSTVPECVREQPGRDRRDHAVAVRGAGPDRDQREHVEVAALDRRPATREEGQPSPEDHRRREGELDPGEPAPEQLLDGVTRNDLGHPENEDDQAQRKADPETARHVGELVVRSLLERRDLRLQRHPANGARAGPFLHDLRVHRARVERVCVGRRRGHRRLGRRLDVTVRLCAELLQAAGIAEKVGLAAVRQPVLGGRGRDHHPADRILHFVRARRRDVLMAHRGFPADDRGRAFLQVESALLLSATRTRL